MNQRSWSEWITIILLIIVIPTVINYFTELTTPFLRLHLSRIIIWPNRRKLRILEEALNQARTFSQDTLAFHHYLLTEIFLILCVLPVCIFTFIMLYIEAPLEPRPVSKDSTFLEVFGYLTGFLSFFSVGVMALFLCQRAAIAFSLIHSVANFREFERQTLTDRHCTAERKNSPSGVAVYLKMRPPYMPIHKPR